LLEREKQRLWEGEGSGDSRLESGPIKLSARRTTFLFLFG